MLKSIERPELRRARGNDRPKWIESWSDGGPKHFKTRRSSFFVCVELGQRLGFECRLTWAFFASHHGKSANDAHAAVVKRTLWRLAREGDCTEGPRALAEVCVNLKNADAECFGAFDRERQFDVSAMPGLKSSHFFERTKEQVKCENVGKKQAQWWNRLVSTLPFA